MEPRLTVLEKSVLAGQTLDLARGALVASGARNQAELERYMSRIEGLCQQLPSAVGAGSALSKARSLFDWLWTTKAGRNESGGSFRLTEVIDAQVDPRAAKVGNCLGLTLLYNVFAQRLGLDVQAVYLEAVAGRLSHVISTLVSGRKRTDIDNIFPDGFDSKDYLDSPLRIEWGDAELIADVYHSIGWELHEKDRLEGAVVNYSKAIWLNPKYVKAYLNRGIALSMQGREDEAKRDLEVGQYRPRHESDVGRPMA
ncbi:MAG: tetratricopeptide repeat protein [Dehalococcoidia bacterium]